jgi:hypothetical protein
MSTVGAFGPWSPDVVDPTEKVAQLRSLAALSAAFLGSSHPLVDTLRKAEADNTAATEALQLLDALPSLTKRRLLSTFGAITWPRPKSRGRS